MGSRNSSSDNSRRDALKKLISAGGAASLTGMVPERWTQPVVSAILLRAHAQATPCFTIDAEVRPATLDLRQGPAGSADADVVGTIYVVNNGDEPFNAQLSLQPLITPRSGFEPPAPGTVSASPTSSPVGGNSMVGFTITYSSGCTDATNPDEETLSGLVRIALTDPDRPGCETEEIVDLDGGCFFASQ